MNGVTGSIRRMDTQDQIMSTHHILDCTHSDGCIGDLPATVNRWRETWFLFFLIFFSLSLNFTSIFFHIFFIFHALCPLV